MLFSGPNGDIEQATTVALSDSARFGVEALIADVDSDGRNDVVVRSYWYDWWSSWSTWWHRGVEGRGLTPPVSLGVVDQHLIDPQFVDLDDDCQKDMIYLLLDQYYIDNQEQHVVWRRGLGGGSFGDAQRLVGLKGSLDGGRLSARDMDYDGRTDILVIDDWDGSLVMLRNEGGGGFTEHAYSSGAPFETVDTDGDGGLEVVLADVGLGSGSHGIVETVPEVTAALSDCNSNGLWDRAEIAVGAGADCDRNGVPDECEPVGVADDEVSAVGVAPLSLWPNPSHGGIHVQFVVAKESQARLSVLDIAGREVAVLAAGTYRPGRFESVWNGQLRGRPAPMGVYFLRYMVHQDVVSRRFVIAR